MAKRKFIKRTIKTSVKYIDVSTRKEAIELARQYSEEFDEGREWLVGVAPDSYGDPTYRTEIHVLEGSGPKGYVVVADGRNHGEVVALNLALFPVAVISWS